MCLHIYMSTYFEVFILQIFRIFSGLYAIYKLQILQNDISLACLYIYATIDPFSKVQMIFFSKEPAIELVHPMPAKVTIYLKIIIVLHSYSSKVSMVTYEFFLSFWFLLGSIFNSGNCE